MPRQPDPNLEERVLKAARLLWMRGGEKALTMRAVARAAHSNTPAVYRRFKNRQDIIRGLLQQTVGRIGEQFASGSLEQMAESYVDYALQHPHEYELFYTYAHKLSPTTVDGRPRPIRDSRPNFGLVERLLAKELGGSPEDHTQLALALWAELHGTTTLLLSKGIAGHEEALREACRTAVKTLLNRAAEFSATKRGGA
jgi:AcrR family transcriptional regulator